MLDCRGIKTPAEAEKFLDDQIDRIDRLWEKVPKDEKGIACEPGFSKFCTAYDEYQAAKQYLIKRGLIWEDTERDYDLT
jgi:phage terminase small subunit